MGSVFLLVLGVRGVARMAIRFDVSTHNRYIIKWLLTGINVALKVSESATPVMRDFKSNVTEHEAQANSDATNDLPSKPRTNAQPSGRRHRHQKWRKPSR